jgi:hypothetical protein
MFVVTEADAAAIRAAFDAGGEFAAAVELRRLFPGVGDTAAARKCARTIAAWKPLPLRPPRLPRAGAGNPEAAPVAPANDRGRLARLRDALRGE